MLTNTPISLFDRSLEVVRAIILCHVPVDCMVFLFGSSINGLRSHGSDIDVGFLGKSPLPDAILSKIRGEIEDSIVPFHVDLVDFHNKPDTFKSVALQSIQIWQSATKKS